jgi:hypothetical protein
VVSIFSLYFCLKNGLQIFDIQDIYEVALKEKSFAVLLNVDYRIPFKKIQALFGDLFGYAINASTVYSSSRQCNEKFKETMEIIKAKIIEALTDACVRDAP